MRSIYLDAFNCVNVPVIEDHNRTFSLFKKNKTKSSGCILSLVNYQSDLMDLTELLKVLLYLFSSQLILKANNENFSLFFV